MRNNYSSNVVTSILNLQNDLQRLISVIRQRESSLLILFQEKNQKKWQRPEWLLKQCQYLEKQNRLSRQIRSIVLKWVLMGNEENLEQTSIKQIRRFWVKIKMVMKMSLERIKILNLLSYQLFEKYQAIIEAMNMGYDRAAGISHYRDIQEMIKNRNKSIHELLNEATPCQFNMDRYNLSGKHHVKQSASEAKIKVAPILSIKKMKESNSIDRKIVRRPLSQQNQRAKLGSKQFLAARKLKNAQKCLENYETKLAGAMDGKLFLKIDKRKNVEENMQNLYEQILQKNIHNHKMISKFIYSHKLQKGISSRKQLRPLAKKCIDVIQTPYQAKKLIKRKIKILNYGRAVSAKIKRKEIKELHKIRDSHIFNGQFKIMKKCL